MASVGKDLVRGMWNGIKSLGGWIKDKIISFVSDKIPGPVKKVLGINSPSRVFAGFGRDIDEGLMLGVDKHADKVENSVTNMADGAINAMTDTLSPNQALFNPVLGAAPGNVQSGDTRTQTVSIENINLQDATAVREFFDRINQDTINIGMGITPLQGAN